MTTNVKWAIFAGLAVFSLLIITSSSEAVATSAIQKVQDKGVLDSGDFSDIDDFVAESLRELVRAKDFKHLAKSRSIILARARSNEDSAQTQYADRFFQAARKHIGAAMDTATKFDDEDRKFIVTVNLLILIDNLISADHQKSLQLTDLAIAKLQDDSQVIRYWAVHCLSNDGIVRKLGNPVNLKLSETIATQFASLIDSSGPEILSLMGNFSAGVNISGAEDLIVKIADMRIRKYADWTVEYEILDVTVLRALSERMLTAKATSRPEIARRFGQLFSYALQRYVKGRKSLNDQQKHQLVSLLAETESKFLRKLLETGPGQPVIRKAIERGDYEKLLSEHTRLLGAPTIPGELPKKFKFNYGPGKKAPLPLNGPPAPKTTE